MSRHMANGGMSRGCGRASTLVRVTILIAVWSIAAVAPPSALAAKPPAVNGLEPAGGPPRGGTSVVIDGAHLLGTTAVKFGSANAASFTVDSESKITAVSPAGTAAVDVTVTTPEGASAISPADVFTYGPHVTGVSPGRGPAGGGSSVTITGTDFAGATAVKFGSASASSFTVQSGTSITAVSPEGMGAVDVTVIEPEATSATGPADLFTYVPPPTVTSVSPAGGPEAGGTTVTIAIAGAEPSEVTAVDFGMSPASFFANNEGSITAFAPPGTGVVDVTVTTVWGGTSLTSFADQFKYVPPPSITAVTPETGPAAGGTSVTITGSGLEGATAVYFGSASATSFTAESESSLTAISPAGTSGETVDVTVTTLGGTTTASANDRFRYLQTAPLLVTKLNPSSGELAGGTPVVISGSAFVGATAVHFGSVSAASFLVRGERKIMAIAPAGTGVVDVTVTTPEGVSPTSSADRFSYVASPPAVEAVSPVEAREKGGTKVTIKGTNLLGATAVHFGPAPASSFAVNATGTVITAVDPPAEAAGKATVDVVITTPEGTSPVTSADHFTYRLMAPIVTGLSINKGPATGGTTLTISGNGFIEVSAVNFGSVGATSFTVNSGKSITATSPAETVGNVGVTVTTPLGVSGPGECTIYREGRKHVLCASHERFRFVEPTVTSVSPDTGPTAGGTTVTISGSGFAVGTEATAFYFGAKALASSVECSSITTCTAVVPPHAAGTVSVAAKILGTKRSAGNPPADEFTYG